VLRTLDQKHQDLLRRLATARQKENNPQSAVWAEAKSLLEVAEDEASRLRLRDLLRTIIAEIWVLIVAQPAQRFCAVQMLFTSGARRDYLILYRPAARNRQWGWWVRSLANMSANSELDLSQKKHVKELDATLSELTDLPEP
jgi:hypothetical protein